MVSISLDALPRMFTELRAWLDRSDTKRRADEQEFRNALESLSTAVLRTKSYLSQLSSGDTDKDLEKEQELSGAVADGDVD